MKNYIWVAYDKEPPFLPVAVADTAKEMAKIVGTSENCIISTWCKYLTGRYPSSRFHKVSV